MPHCLTSKERHIAQNIDDLTVHYEEDGLVKVEELDRTVLTHGAWTTIIFRCRQWDIHKEAYGPEQYTIRRYKKTGGEYRQQSKFTISSPNQARKIIEVLRSWLDELD
ncbi:conserved hypothetical protein [Desulfovibrionales bacterium]